MLAEWENPETGEVVVFELPQVEVEVSEGEEEPVLYGPDGQPAWRLTRRVPFGFRP